MGVVAGPFGQWGAIQKADEKFWKVRAEKRSAYMQGRSTDDRVQVLDDELCRLHLVVRALTDVLRKNGQLTELQFSEALRRIDLEDGVEDGRVTKKRAAVVPPPAAPTPGRRR